MSDMSPYFEGMLFIKCVWFTAAQKARDAFHEAERALREVDDQIKWVHPQRQ